MKSSMQKSEGFTLIELIVVIVILGIMAAVAGPKFVNLQSDARASVIKGVEGSIRSAATLIYSKSLIAGTETGNSTVTVATVTYATVEGYPAQADASGNSSINDLIDLSGASSITAATDNGIFTYTGKTNCQVAYVESAGANLAPTITATTTGC